MLLPGFTAHSSLLWDGIHHVDVPWFVSAFTCWRTFWLYPVPVIMKKAAANICVMTFVWVFSDPLSVYLGRWGARCQVLSSHRDDLSLPLVVSISGIQNSQCTNIQVGQCFTVSLRPELKIKSCAPGWLTQKSMWLLIWGSWIQAPCWCRDYENK